MCLGLETGAERATRISCSTQGEYVLIRICVATQSGPAQLAKRSMNIARVFVIIIVFSPWLTLIGMTVKISNQEDSLSRQLRIGKDGTPFSNLKFRTMATGAGIKLMQFFETQGADTVPLSNVSADPRINRGGGIFRKYFLVELRQLFTGLRADMNLVGIGPLREQKIGLHCGESVHRLFVSLSVTGTWQASGRLPLGWGEEQKLDINYADDWSSGGYLHPRDYCARCGRS